MVLKYFKFFIGVILLSITLFSVSVSAQETGLVHCGLSGIETCTWNDLFTLINTVITFLIEVSLLLATIAIVVSGVQLVWSPDNSTAHSVWKNRLQTAVWGLIIMLTAFLIVKTIVWGLTGGESVDDVYQLRNVLEQ